MISQRIRNFKLGTLHRTQVTGSAGMALLLTFAQDLGLGKEFCDQGGTEVYRLLAGAARFLAPVGSSGAVFAAMLRLLTSPSGRGYSSTMDWGANSMSGGGIQLARKKQFLILPIPRSSMFCDRCLAHGERCVRTMASRPPEPAALACPARFPDLPAVLDAAQTSFYTPLKMVGADNQSDNTAVKRPGRKGNSYNSKRKFL